MRPRLLLLAFALVVAVVGAAVPRQAIAGDTPASGSMPGGWVAMDPARLETMRGGYGLPSGLLLSFGFQRVAFVNGDVVAQVAVNIPDVGSMTPAQAQALSALVQAQRVQVGSGNVFQDPAHGGLVIQNSLDGQTIRTQTTVEASVGTLALYQAMNATQALRDAGQLGAAGL